MASGSVSVLLFTFIQLRLLASEVQACNAGDLRLVGGTSANEGRVEVCVGGQWGTVCGDDSWDSRDARVVCRQLGYSPKGATSFSNAQFGRGTGPIFVDDANCVGTEERLLDCSYLTESNCGHSEDASVRCSTRELCNSGGIRLVAGGVAHRGRLEACVGEEWGTVCDDNFDRTDAAVVCRQLGFSRFGPTYYGAFSSPFPAGSGSIVMDNVRCRGTELSLLDCPFTSDHNCLHAEDIGILCKFPPKCKEGELRLNGSSRGGNSSGRVEVCKNEEWGTICRRGWTAANTRVTCRQLGYSIHGAQLTLPVSGVGPIHLGYVRCRGNETELIDCQSSTSRSGCSHSYDLGIRCNATVQCHEGDVRLVGGTKRRGRVEVCVGEVWGTVCNDFFGSNEATVICRQLGESRYGARGYTSGGGTDPIHLDNLHCMGSELNLLACPHITTHNCVHSEDAGVSCQPVSCENGAIRLVGRSRLSGRVEVCWNETWGTVCDQSWSAPDATVVCRELGFSRLGASSYSNATFGRGTGPILLNSVNCTGSELSLISCPHNCIGDIGVCTHADDAGVGCREVLCDNGDVRLVDGLSPYEGRLEVCVNGVWGTVCDDLWNTRAIGVACRSLDFNNTVAVDFLSATSFPTASSSVQIFLDNVVCSGLETSLFNCSHAIIGRHNCGHIEDVHIRCSQCTEYSVRLLAGRTSNEGRVEVCVSGTWGTICDDGWDHLDAKVVCRHLGLPTAGVQALGGGIFPSNPSLPIVMDAVVCNGTESNLGDCLYRGASQLRACSHHEDAGVRCAQDLAGAPHNVSISILSSYQWWVFWNHPPLSEWDGDITGYVLSVVERASGSGSEINVSATTSHILKSLHPYYVYTIKVATVTERGQGQFSSAVSARTDVAEPSGPPNIIQTNPSPHSIHIYWTPPPSHQQNGPLTHYIIAILTNGVVTTFTFPSSATEGQIPARPHSEYMLAIAAATSAGLGPYSTPVTTVRTLEDVESG